MVNNKIRFDWKNDKVTYLWHDIPFVIAGHKILDTIIDDLESKKNIPEIAKKISKKYNTDLGQVTSFISNIFESLLRAGVLSEIHENTNQIDSASNQGLCMTTLNITNNCNLECLHCYANKNHTIENTVSDIEIIINKLGKLIKNEPKLLIFSGGEPTLELEKLMNAILFAKKNSLKPRVNTNGLNVTDELAKFFAENQVFVQVSIDGIDAKTHALLRKSEESFYQAVNAVKCLVKNNCRVRISFTTHNQNYKQIPEMIHFAQELGAEQFITSNLINVGNACKNHLKGIDFDTEFDILYNVVKLDKNLQEMTKATLLAESINAIREGIKFVYCGTGCSTSCVDSNGNIYPCINLVNDNYLVGNLLNDDISIWEKSSTLNELRKLNIDTMNDNCSICAFRYFCGGFCRGETLESGNLINSKYIRCNSWKKGLNRIMFYLADTPDLYYFNENYKGGFYRE